MSRIWSYPEFIRFQPLGSLTAADADYAADYGARARRERDALAQLRKSWAAASHVYRDGRGYRPAAMGRDTKAARARRNPKGLRPAGRRLKRGL